MSLISVAAMLSFAAAVPAVAAAQGNSAIDEYLETVPNGGHHPGGGDAGGGTAGHKPDGPALPDDAAQALESQGPAGAAAAELAQATAPPGEGNAGAGADGGGGAGSGPGASGAGGAGEAHEGSGPSVGDVARAVAGGSESGGLGLALPVILGAALLTAIAVPLLRRRGDLGRPSGV